MKILRIFALMALVWLGAPVYAADPADPPSIIGRLNYVSGQVSFAPGEASNEWREAPLNRPLTTGDRLWVDNGGRAEMHVGSNSIRLAEQTNVDILGIDDRLIQLGLTQGTLHIHLRRPVEGGVFEVAAPHGAVHLTQPGIYRVAVEPSGQTTAVIVRTGHAEVLTGQSRLAVHANSQVVLPAARAQIVAAAQFDEFDRWAEGRDQKRARIVAARYVPPEMTGYEDLDEHGSWRTVGTYGTVWVPSRVPDGWAPFRNGHWAWISPWGWTWVDDAPWGFAPAHYGRWVWVDRYWAWAPGPATVRPVYAPAVVAFIGGGNFSVSIGASSAPAVAWVPLGWREPYIPWYRVSQTYVRNVNVAYVRDINVTNIYNIVNRNTTVTNLRYVNRDVPSAVTVTSRDVFVNARRVEPVKVSAQVVRSAPVVAAAPVSAPEKTSFAPAKSGNKPPPAAVSREVIAATPPPTRVRDERVAVRKDDREAVATKGEERQRVRVISRDTTQPTQPSAAGDAKQQTDRAKAPEREEKSSAQKDQKAGPSQAEREKGPTRDEKAAQRKGPERDEKAAEQKGPDQNASPQQAERDKGPGRDEKSAQQKGSERDQRAAEQKGRDQKASPQQAERDKGPGRDEKSAQQKGPERDQKAAEQKDLDQKASPRQAERDKGPGRDQKAAQRKGLERDQKPQQAERKGPPAPVEKPAPQQAEGKGPAGEKPSPQQAERKGPDRDEKSSQSQAKSQRERGEEKVQEAQRPAPPPAAGGERLPGKAEPEDRGKKKSERESE